MTVLQETLQPTLGKVFVTKDYDGKDFSSGFAAFDKVLSSEEVETVKEKVPTIAGSAVEWAAPSGGMQCQCINTFVPC